MTDDRTLERAARSWLEEGPTQAPDRPVDAALARIQTTSQERGLALPWRLPTMNPFMRLAGAAIVAVLAAGVVFLVLRPSSSVGPPATPSPIPSSSGSVTPTIELPSARPLAPTAVIDLAGMVKDTIPLTTDGIDVWVGVDGAVIHVDGTTNATVRIDVPDMKTGNGGIALASDGLWIEDYAGNQFERIDPISGTVEVQGTAPGPPRTIAFYKDELWVGVSGALSGVYQVNRTTGSLGPKVGQTDVFAVGLRRVWVGEWDGVAGEHLQSDVITRLDPSGETTGTITVPVGAGCAVSGAFPDNIWAACPADFGTCPANRVAVRIDPATNRVVTTARICGGPVAVVDGTPWFLAGRKEGADEAYSLVSVNPATGQLLAQLDLGKIGPDVVVLTATAMWMSDEYGDRLVRYDLSALRG